MANLTPLRREQLAELEPLFAMIEAQTGFVPNSLFTMGRRPDLLRAFVVRSAAYEDRLPPVMDSAPLAPADPADKHARDSERVPGKVAPGARRRV